MVTLRAFGDDNQGPPIVLVHGWCCTGDVWRHQIEAFAGRWRLIAVELGHPDPETQDVSIAATGAALAAALDREGIDACTLVGHSMGGPVALEAARRLRDRCRAVIGVDTFTDAAFYAARPEAEIARRLEPFRHDFAGTMTTMIGRITLAGTADLRRWIARMMAEAPRPSALTRMTSLLAHDIEALWPTVPCPVATINSAPLDHPEARLTLAGLDATWMPEVGHFPMLEAPDAFNRHLARALAMAPLKAVRARNDG